MQKKWLIGLCMSCSILFSGCAVPFMGDKTVKEQAVETTKKTPAEKVVISELDILDRPYKIIGDVSAIDTSSMPFSKPTQLDATIKLREAASAMGADAVIYVTYSKKEGSMMSGSGIEAKGKAIKFTRY